MLHLRNCSCGQIQVLPRRGKAYQNATGIDVNKEVYLTTKTKTVKTPEGEVMDSLKLTNVCCRTRMLTHVDIE
jgi:DNA-directed RNA polymerase subunit N (RpoN/RPB10)